MRLGLRCLRYCVDAHDLMEGRVHAYLEGPHAWKGGPFMYQHES